MSDNFIYVDDGYSCKVYLDVELIFTKNLTFVWDCSETYGKGQSWGTYIFDMTWQNAASERDLLN